MQPDIPIIDRPGSQVLDKLGLLDDAERSLVRPYVACLELFLDDVRARSFLGKPRRPTSSPSSKLHRSQGAARVIARRRTTPNPVAGSNVFGDDY